MRVVTGRYIDDKAWHVVITRRGDVVQHHRFVQLGEADAFAAEVEDTGTLPMPTSGRAKGGALSTFNRPVAEMQAS